jgi:hypothetical protein
VTNNFREMARLSPVQRWLPGTGVLFPFALVGIAAWLSRRRIRRSRRDAGILLLAFGVLALFAAVISFPVTRERLPAMAVLLLFVGPAVRTLGTAAQARRWPVAAGWLLALGLAFAVVHVPLPDGGVTRQEAFLTELARGDAQRVLWARDRQPERLGEALAAYERALQLQPDSVQPLQLLTILHWEADRPAEGLAVQQRLLDRLRQEYPRNVTILGRELGILSRLAMRANRPEIAEAAAREWRALGVDGVRPLDMQVVALAAQGKWSEAFAIAAERARLAPEDPESERMLQMLRQSRGEQPPR